MFVKKQIRLLIAVTVAALCCAPQMLLACPTCKDSLAGDPAAANMARAYQYSILFMMSMPFLILLALGAYFYWEIRRARKAVLRAASLSAESAAAATHSSRDSASETHELAEVGS